MEGAELSGEGDEDAPFPAVGEAGFSSGTVACRLFPGWPAAHRISIPATKGSARHHDDASAEPETTGAWNEVYQVFVFFDVNIKKLLVL